MAKNPHRGKCFYILQLYLLFSFGSVSRVLVSCDSVSTQQEQELELDPYSEPEIEFTRKFNQQEVWLHKLEDLVRNLSEIVTRLESNLPEFKKVAITTDEKHSDQGKDKIRQKDYDGERLAKDFEDEGFEGKAGEGEKARAVSVTKYSRFWSERFQFVSAVKLDSDATCMNVLPFRDYEGLTKYVAVGDERGRVYVFLRNGDVMVEFYTMSEWPITAMLSYMSVYKNESVVVTGHRNGAISMHRVWEGSTGEEWTVFMENVGKFVSAESEEDVSPINVLEVHHIGRMRYILSVDDTGKIRVFTENGTLYGSTMPTSRPLAFLKQRLLFLTESGAGSLDLRSMKVKESECEGLNHSLAQNYVVDATERFNAYGFTSESDLIHVVLLGDIMNFKCRVRSKRKFDMDEPLAFQAIKGYLIVVSEEKVFVYNVSSRHYVRVGAPRLVFSTGLDEVRSSFLSYQTMDVDAERRRVIPLVATDREKLLVLGLGSGYVGMYQSNLPVFKGEYDTMLWTSPVLFFILFLFGAWHFFAKKKEALTTSWGPDDLFTSTSATNGAPVGTSSGDRSFVDSSSRGADMMDIRGGGLRGPSRRYASPTRYPGGAASSFRQGSVDHNSRQASVDANVRASSELKFRGSTLESSGFPKRRESLFISNQVVDDSN